ncbi:Ldh family oxidoreductase [Brenneria tiliae]|uniref:Ldh family oxidoreductase n=1 Tax=Brenneria tiliae TaxID=2914984 RepID=UPI002014925F|nr:Ldh family oxidoreductase [Brenneria tiliae]MCL2897122.1 Ldh family oxidoreductase [Brenneria tiliae]MCL2904775.1 Ldh family oxidoreductase [Brenneria tiliae]
MKDIFVGVQQLRNFIETVFIHEGVQTMAAKQAADTLLYADLSGLDTHGVLNLLSIYITGIRDRRIDISAEMTVLRDQEAVMGLNANRMLGLNAGEKAMHNAIHKAKKFGVGVVSVCNSTHFGAAGYYSQLALSEDMLGLAMTNLGAEPVAHAMGSRQPVIGTNPLSLAVPVDRLPDFVLDMSTTICASGKIKQARERKCNIPKEWLYDKHGDPVTDPDAYYSKKAFLPGLGGWEKTSGGHKGFGLNMMVEILSGVLSGADVSLLEKQNECNNIGHFFLVLNTAYFMSVPAFKKRMMRMLERYLETKMFDNFPPLHYAGYPDEILRDKRNKFGVPIPATLFEELNVHAQQNNIQLLESIL